MEPFRPFVDGIAWELWRAGIFEGEIDRPRKTHLLAVLNLGVAMDGQAMPLSLALHRAASSLAESFAARRNVLRLPEGPAGLPQQQGTEDVAPPSAAA